MIHFSLLLDLSAGAFPRASLEGAIAPEEDDEVGDGALALVHFASDAHPVSAELSPFIVTVGMYRNNWPSVTKTFVLFGLVFFYYYYYHYLFLSCAVCCCFY